MRRYTRIYAACVRNCLIRDMEFRGHFVFSAAASASWAFLSMVLAGLIFGNVPQVVGWDLDRMFILTGTFLLVDYAASFLLQRNMSGLSQLVNKGELDFVLTKPISSQFLVSIRYVDFTDLPGVFVGVAWVLIGVQRVDLRPSPLDLAAYLVLVACALLAIYAFWFMTVTLALWTGRINNIAYLASPVLDLARMPSDIFRGLARPIVTFVLPIALAATIPARALLGILEPWIVPYEIALTGVLLWTSHRFWNYSLVRYSSASS